MLSLWRRSTTGVCPGGYVHKHSCRGERRDAFSERARTAPISRHPNGDVAGCVALTSVQEDLEEEGDASSGASPDYSAWWDEMLPAP